MIIQGFPFHSLVSYLEGGGRMGLQMIEYFLQQTQYGNHFQTPTRQIFFLVVLTIGTENEKGRKLDTDEPVFKSNIWSGGNYGEVICLSSFPRKEDEISPHSLICYMELLRFENLSVSRDKPVMTLRDAGYR